MSLENGIVLEITWIYSIQTKYMFSKILRMLSEC